MEKSNDNVFQSNKVNYTTTKEAKYSFSLARKKY